MRTSQTCRSAQLARSMLWYLAWASWATHAQAITINLDGNTGDWTGIPATITDASGDRANAGQDIEVIKFTNDVNNLYVLLQYRGSPHGGSVNFGNNVWLDTDFNSSTGLNDPITNGVGAEFTIQLRAKDDPFLGDPRDASWAPTDFPGALSFVKAGRFVEMSVPISTLETITPQLSGFDVTHWLDTAGIGKYLLFSGPIDAGGGTTVEIDPGNIQGNGVSVDELLSEHKLSAQSVNGTPPVMDTGSVERKFVFQRNDGSTDPTTVYLTGDVQGRLLTDNGGGASVSTSLVLRSATGSTVAEDVFAHAIDSNINQIMTANVRERLDVTSQLTPGETYSLFSRMTVSANSPLGGAGRAFFDETYTVSISAEMPPPLVPEPGTLPLLLLGAAGSFCVLRRKDRVDCGRHDSGNLPS